MTDYYDISPLPNHEQVRLAAISQANAHYANSGASIDDMVKAAGKIVEFVETDNPRTLKAEKTIEDAYKALNELIQAGEVSRNGGDEQVITVSLWALRNIAHELGGHPF